MDSSIEAKRQIKRSSSSDVAIPYYCKSVDWDQLIADYPPPPNFWSQTGNMRPVDLRSLQNARFLQRVREAWQLPFYRDRWLAAGITPDQIKSLDDIERIPPFTSDDLREAIAVAPPFGSHHPSISALAGRRPLKVHTSGGTTGFPRPTLFDPIAMEVQGIQTARALYAQSVRPGDVVQITYTLSMANASWCGFKGSFDWLGCVALTTGAGTITPSERQIEYARTFGTTSWYSSGDYLARLTQVAANMGVDLHQLATKALHTFLGADVEGVRKAMLEAAWNAPVYDNYGSHEVGHIAFECAHGRRHVSDDTVYVEACDVETGAAVPFGEQGNIVVTSLHRSVPVFIRYNLRDLMRVYDAEPCSCGLCTRSLSMFLGRSDEMVKVRGTNVYPAACHAIINKDPRANGEFVCVVYHDGEGLAQRTEMLIRVERRSRDINCNELAEDLTRALHQSLGVRLKVDVVDPDSLQAVTTIAGTGKTRRVIDQRGSPGQKR